jgi:hypothetical protein
MYERGSEGAMHFEDKSIRDQIDCLAKLTGAPDSFVEQVRELFTRKGISLDDDSSPYLRALEEAFIREESIRIGTIAARSAGAELEPVREARPARRSAEPAAARDVRIDARPLLVTRRQHEEQPLVPGPEELQ